MDDTYDDAQAVRKPSGAIILDGNHVADTVHCKHCGGHFVMRKGSGTERGWCTHCDGMVCGRQCAACVPMEQQLELMEAAGRRN